MLFLCFINESFGNSKFYKFLVGRYIRIAKKLFNITDIGSKFLPLLSQRTHFTEVCTEGRMRGKYIRTYVFKRRQIFPIGIGSGITSTLKQAA